MVSDLGPRILVSDFTRMFDFYKDTLGYEVAWGTREGVYASFKVPGEEGIALAIFLRQNMEMYEGYQLNERHISDNVHLIISVEDTDSEFERLKDKIDFYGVPRNMDEWMMRCVWFRDPEGNLLEFNSRIK